MVAGRHRSDDERVELVELQAVLRKHSRSSVFASRCRMCGESWECTTRVAIRQRLCELASRPVQGSEAKR